ncbi:hypothetical protein BD769DRAFT_1398554 [Suillus cothurnatus]|nr:hypothetical protein BD769DRAFT_1398554 [Suillus cothurnatus]
MWDHWVPPKFWLIPSPQKDGIVVGHNTAHTRPNIISTSWARQLKKDIASTMPSSEDRKYFGNEVFDMCWNTEADQEPMVETLTAKHLAEPHYGGQMFDMCWNTEADQVLAVETPAGATQSTKPYFGGQTTPLATTHYGLCWDDKQSQPKVDLLPILELATAKIQSVGITAVQYDMCWDDQPSTLAVGHEADYDMCWGDLTSGGGDHLESVPTINSVNSGLKALTLQQEMTED